MIIQGWQLTDKNTLHSLIRSPQQENNASFIKKNTYKAAWLYFINSSLELKTTEKYINFVKKKCIFIEVLQHRGGMGVSRQMSSSEKSSEICRPFFQGWRLSSTRNLHPASVQQNFNKNALFIHRFKIFKLFSTLKITGKFRKYIQAVLYLVFSRNVCYFLLEAIVLMRLLYFFVRDLPAIG